MELQTFLAFLMAAAISLVAAAVLLAVRPRTITGRSTSGPWRDGAVSGPLAIALAVVLTSPYVLGSWPAWPPRQASDWCIWLIPLAAAAWGVLGLRLVPLLVAAPAVALAAAWAVTAYPLQRPLAAGSALPQADAWRMGIVLATGLLGLVVGAAHSSAQNANRRTGGGFSRFAASAWAPAAFAVLLCLAGPAGVFSYSVKFGQLLVVLSGAWIGLIAVAIPARVNLAPSAVTALIGLAAMWLSIHFFAGPPEETAELLGIKRTAFAILAAAPGGLLVGLLPSWSGRPRARLITTVLACALLAGAALATLAPSYLKHAAQSGSAGSYDGR